MPAATADSLEFWFALVAVSSRLHPPPDFLHSQGEDGGKGPKRPKKLGRVGMQYHLEGRTPAMDRRAGQHGVRRPPTDLLAGMRYIDDLHPFISDTQSVYKRNLLAQ